MEKIKKSYQKPKIEKVNLRERESVLVACKTSVRTQQPSGNVICGGAKAYCSTDQGS